jgi:hypothetical protein
VFAAVTVGADPRAIIMRDGVFLNALAVVANMVVLYSCCCCCCYYVSCELLQSYFFLLCCYVSGERPPWKFFDEDEAMEHLFYLTTHDYCTKYARMRKEDSHTSGY